MTPEEQAVLDGWSNAELITKLGRAKYVVESMKTLQCGVKHLARLLNSSQSTLQDLITYSGFVDPPEAGGPPGGPTTDKEVVFGTKGSGHSLNEIVQNYKPDEEEVEALKEEGFPEATARRLSRAAEAGRNTKLERLPSGKMGVVHTPEEQAGLDEMRRQVDAVGRKQKVCNVSAKFIEHSNMYLGHYLPSIDFMDCPDPYILKTLRRIANDLRYVANLWEAAIEEEQKNGQMQN